MSQDIKYRILKNFERLVFRFGIRSITMDDVAKQMGISKKTIYKFYKNKREVVHSLVIHKLKEDQIAIVKIQRKSKNIVDEIFGLMKHLSIEFPKINPTVFYELQKYYPLTWKLFKDFKLNCVLGMIEAGLKKGIKDGVVRKDINIQILTRLRIEEIEMGFNNAIFPSNKFKIIDVQLALVEHFLYGICTLKGHQLIMKYKQLSRV